MALGSALAALSSAASAAAAPSTLMTLLPAIIAGAGGLTKGVAEGLEDSPAEIQAQLARENRTAPGFDDFGAEMAGQMGPNLTLKNARRPVMFNRAQARPQATMRRM